VTANPVPWRLTTRQRLISSLSLDQLFAFQTVVRVGSFRAAAAELALTQPAVSQRMRHLENLLGCQLFDRRRGAPAQLTAAGHEVLSLADDVLTRMDYFHRRLEEMKGRAERSTLTIVSGSDHIKYLLIEAVAAVRRADPSLRIVIKHLPSAEQIIQELSRGNADLGICRAPVDDRVQTIGTINEELLLFAHPDDPITKVPPERRIAQLSVSDFAAFATGMRSRDMVDRWAEKAGVTLRPIIESRNLEAMRACVTRGLAVAVLPRVCAEDDLRNGRVVIVPTPGLPLTRTMVLIADPQRTASYEVRTFVKILSARQDAGHWVSLERRVDQTGLVS
jgi:DNA-binding transcriptional LysR family regulator